MEQNELLVLKCVNPECAKQIKLKRPEKTGVYPIACPNCGKKMRVKITGKTPQEILATPPAPDFSNVEPICLGTDFKVGEKYEEKCPHCKDHILVFQSSKPGHKEFACPRCKGRITAEVRQPTKTVHADSDVLQLIRGKLVLLRKNWFNKDYPLREGRNIVGREDASAPSDISIKGDNTMSRRSVQIDMNHTGHGYSFKLTVIKAANPVIHNGSVLMNGESVSLNFGDTIVMGSTKFRFDRLD